ncbi:hypothetical protein BC332_30595 [Capsicum chinense]|nr:hypothetical protein BC332_30595 [Capsicum chinense]
MPPPIKKLPGRPGKNRKKEEGETKKKIGKFSKRGIEISCSTFHSKGHNKRRCPTGAPAAGTNENPGPSSSAGADPSAGPSVVPSTTPTVGKERGSTGRGRGRPPKHSTKKCAGKPRMIRMGLLHTQSGCTILNLPGMSSERFKIAKSSAFVTGNLRYTPNIGVKWKGKKAMTSRKL